MGVHVIRYVPTLSPATRVQVAVPVMLELVALSLNAKPLRVEVNAGSVAP